MKTIMTKKKYWIIIPLVSILIISLSCNLPLLAGGGNRGGSLEEDLLANGLIFVDEVEISEELVKISYQILPDDNPEVITSGWLNALLAAYEAEPDAGAYQLETSMNGEPYLEVTAQGLDLEGLADESLSGDEFLARLVVIDNRPADVRALDLLVPLDLDLDEISLDGGVLSVSYRPGPSADQAEVMAEWWGIFKALADLGEKVDAIEIKNLYLDGSVITVRLETSVLQAYVSAEIGDLEYMASLDIESELVELDAGEEE